MLTLILIFSAFVSYPTGLIGAFLAGVWIDIWQGNRIGGTPLLLMGIVFFVNMYKQKFTSASLGFLIPSSLLIAIIFQMVDEKQVFVSLRLYDILMQLAVTVFFYGIVTIIWRFLYTEKKLSV